MKTPRLDRQIELMNMHKALDELTIEGEQSLKEYTEIKQLIIADVSQQRELLKAFQEYYQAGDYNDEYPFDENINRFLKAFNCG